MLPAKLRPDKIEKIIFHFFRSAISHQPYLNGLLQKIRFYIIDLGYSGENIVTICGNIPVESKSLNRLSYI